MHVTLVDLQSLIPLDEELLNFIRTSKLYKDLKPYLYHKDESLFRFVLINDQTKSILKAHKIDYDKLTFVHLMKCQISDKTIKEKKMSIDDIFAEKFDDIKKAKVSLFSFVLYFLKILLEIFLLDRYFMSMIIGNNSYMKNLLSIVASFIT